MALIVGGFFDFLALVSLAFHLPLTAAICGVMAIYFAKVFEREGV